MTINSILDSKFHDFIWSNFRPYPFESAVMRTRFNHADNYTRRIFEFIDGFSGDNREYLLRKFLDWLNNYELEEKSFHTLGGLTKDNVEFFAYKIDNLKGDLILELQNISEDLDTEMFNKEEWEELKSKIDTISEQLFELIERNDAGHEVIYESVEEIKEELLSKAESGKIFGKEFVTQQLSGKILDMTFKASFFAMLSNAPEKLSSLSQFVQKLL
ncbi:hypothetical protein [Sphingobacterium sp. HSC-15S19]|uniref:hypothetical protein n=1 Tax=Sphingobacterium sp. HSC-15S19 TaxID=2910971 RepID=UPI003D1D8A5F